MFTITLLLSGHTCNSIPPLHWGRAEGQRSVYMGFKLPPYCQPSHCVLWKVCKRDKTENLRIFV